MSEDNTIDINEKLNRRKHAKEIARLSNLIRTFAISVDALTLFAQNDVDIMECISILESHKTLKKIELADILNAKN